MDTVAEPEALEPLEEEQESEGQEELARNQEPPLFEPSPPLPRRGRKRKAHRHEDVMVRWACGETAPVRNARLREAHGDAYSDVCCGWCLEGICQEHDSGRWTPFTFQ